jgi:phage shock protein C
MEPKRLQRSQTVKVIAGVCGGMAEYFDVDPVIMRVLFILLTVFGGTGIILYIASWILMPKKPLNQAESSPEQHEEYPMSNIRKIFGIGLIGLGSIILLANLGLFSFFHFWDVSWSFIFPILLILLGMAIIYYKQTKIAREQTPPGDQTAEQSQPGEPRPGYRPFRRSMIDKKLFGVCGGLAGYFSVDSTIIRILYIILCLASFGAGVILYVTLALLVPEDHSFQRQP